MAQRKRATEAIPSPYVYLLTACLMINSKLV